MYTGMIATPQSYQKSHKNDVFGNFSWVQGRQTGYIVAAIIALGWVKTLI